MEYISEAEIKSSVKIRIRVYYAIEHLHVSRANVFIDYILSSMRSKQPSNFHKWFLCVHTDAIHFNLMVLVCGSRSSFEYFILNKCVCFSKIVLSGNIKYSHPCLPFAISMYRTNVYTFFLILIEEFWLFVSAAVLRISLDQFIR